MKRKKPGRGTTIKNVEEGFTFDKNGNAKLPQIDQKTFSMLLNGISDGLIGGVDGISGLGGALNSADTLWKNNRWYLISNFRNLISESYIEHGILRTVVDVPVDDGFRGGVEIHTKELEPEQIEELVAWMEETDDLGVLSQTAKWNRLFGGAGTVINVDQDPSTPLNLNKITRFELYAADLWELFWNRQNTEDYSLAIDSNYQMMNVEYYNFYSQKLHKSRVMKQKGIEAPSLIRPRMRGWGVSVVEVLVNSINQYLKSNRVLFEVMDEYKIDYYKIKNYAASLLNPQAYAATTKRVSHANRQKNYMNAVLMDTDDEWMQKQLSFAGLAEVGRMIKEQVASDLRMPMAKVFGISSQGFGSGQDDIENYNSMVEGEVRHKNKYHILQVIKIRCQLMFGFVPKDLKINFYPLRMMTAEQEENVKTQKHARLLATRTAGEMTSEEFRQGCNKGKLLEIQLETDPGIMKQLEKEKADKEASTVEPAKKAPQSKTKPPEAKE